MTQVSSNGLVLSLVFFVCEIYSRTTYEPSEMRKHRRKRACSGCSKSVEHILVVCRIVLGCEGFIGDYVIDFIVLQ
jgi:hypothetical protein